MLFNIELINLFFKGVCEIENIKTKPFLVGAVSRRGGIFETKKTESQKLLSPGQDKDKDKSSAKKLSII